MNILIVEDDIILAEKIGKVFKLSGNFNNIKLLHSYNSFLKVYHMVTNYDIILVDIILSKDYNDKNNGIKIVNLIRQKTDSIPVIIISGLGDINWLENAFLYGVNDYLIKPFRLRELEIRVDRWFKIFLFNNINIKKEISYYGLRKDLFIGEYYFNDIKLNLTKSSKYILGLFLLTPERLLTDLFLIDKIWGDISSVIERNPRVNINRLKKSLKLVGIDNRIINIWGEGYMLKKS